jgi:serine/threonine protein kinase
MNLEAVADPIPQAKGRIAPFGKYLLLQRVSVGGMAEVFKAIPDGATRIDQIVAVKRILPNIAEDREFIGMFIDEARIAGQLTHPNICRIYELGRVGGDHYIAMQFLWGRDLLKVMNRYKKAGEVMSPPMAAFIAARACAALHYAHTKRDAAGAPLNIIHRDVSPQNIIVGYSGQVKLIDFGVARAASQSQKTQAGILKGKFGYMSPEMIRSLPVDHRSDVFAMGICLHEALTGSRLFYGETDFQTLEQVRDARVLPPSAKAPGIPPALDAIVLKALARDVEDRFPTARAMEQALDGFLDSLYPGYGEADVGAGMRQAFAQEVEREKLRLELFSDMLSRGDLVRGASVPPLPSEPPPSGERSTPPSDRVSEDRGRTKKSDLSDEELAQLSLEQGMPEEQTQIFFSAQELDEIQVVEHENAHAHPPRAPQGFRKPPISELVTGERLWSAPALPIGTPSDRPLRPSGMYERARPPFQARPDERRIPTITFRSAGQADADATLPDLPPKRRLWHPLAVGALAFTLLVGGYAVTRMAQTRTSTLEIENVGDPGALVRIDGILRGNPPLVVEGLEPGLHQIEIDAKGYDPVRMSVHVAAGEVRPLRPLLQRVDTRPRVAALARPAPVVQPSATPTTSTPTTSPAPPAATSPESAGASAPPPTERPRPLPRKAPKAAPAVAPEDGEPVVEVADVGETDVAEVINQETLAAGQGELLISTLPWSRVFVDGIDTGRDTPVRALPVPAGAHRIGLRTPDGLMHDVEVNVEAGKVVRIIRRF